MFSKLLRSKIFFILLVIASVASAIELTVEIHRRQSIEALIQKQTDTIKSIDADNQQLSEVINYFNSDAFVESEARKKLNLSKPGESLIVLESTPTSTAEIKKDSNIDKWFNYFFHG